MAGNGYQHDVRDDQWERIRKFIENPKKTGRPPSNMRKMLNGVIWLARNGATWRSIPREYGPHSTVYGWYALWDKEGILEKIFNELKADADLQDMGTDSTCAKVHQHAAGAKKEAPNAETSQEIGLSRGGKNTKIHVVVDGLGNPIHVHLSAGNIHDSKEAPRSINNVSMEGSTVMGDKAYSSALIRALIEAKGGIVCIPPKSNEKNPWPCDYDQYKERHLVECFFQKLKQYRAVATRYAKLASRFLALVHLACVLIWLA